MATSWAAGTIVAAACNLINNLPAGLPIPLATGVPVPPSVTNAPLIGVDLGPNLSVTGSLATILWPHRPSGTGNPSSQP
jgi:arsenical pump membrane protein